MRNIFDSRSNLLKILLLHHKILMLKQKRKQYHSRRWWVKEHLKQRNILGAYRVLFLYFKENDHEEFYKLTRLTLRQFDLLHQLVKRKLQKNSWRESISTEMRLASVIV